MKEYIEIDTNQVESMSPTSNLFENRCKLAELKRGKHEVTLIVVAYNGLEKVKNCVESVLRYTKEINYELLLIDNGSADGTLEYFRSVECEHKRIIHITKNLGAFYPLMNVDFDSLGDFICYLNNDSYVTPHWMDNLLTCIKSDSRIAMASPMYSNPSYDIDDMTTLTFTSYEDMLQKAEQYNVSDAKKWWDMVRPSTFCALLRKEAILSIGWPYWDVGFYHKCADDDLGFRFRRMGYRTIKAGDTWVYHDHDMEQYQSSRNILDSGLKNFEEKYFGLTYKDFANFYFPYLRQFPAPAPAKKMSVLGVDVKCGTPALDVKNWLQTFGISDVTLSAFIQDPKYWVDLKTICSGPVICDREEFLLSDFPRETFDYIVVDQPINCYHNPEMMLRALFQLCADGGHVVCKLFNTFSFREYMTMLNGAGNYTTKKVSFNISLERFQNMLEEYGDIRCRIETASMAEDELKQFAEWLPEHLTEAQRKAVNQMKNVSYMFVVEKFNEGYRN